MQNLETSGWKKLPYLGKNKNNPFVKQGTCYEDFNPYTQ